MPVPTRKERFIYSKCDRCGKATPTVQNGEHDLFTLPEDWGELCAGEGSFCQRCIDRYDPDNWRQWLIRRDKTLEV